MRKILAAALVLLALGCFAGAGKAWAGCAEKCGSCKDKCHSTCKSACNKCESKCNTCKPKCGCDKCAKPKCGSCKSKCGSCNTCKPKCSKPKCGCGHKKGCCSDCCSRTPVATWGGGSWWNGDACCPPDLDPVEVCNHETPCGCKKPKHPYENCWNGTGMLCDTGCSAFIPCKRKCVTCETVCKEVECTDACGCKQVHYETETVCTEITRPRTIPWWFNPKGDGNTYLDDNGNKIGEAKAEAVDAGWSADSETVTDGKA